MLRSRWLEFKKWKNEREKIRKTAERSRFIFDLSAA
jgi:hypothetical protein